VLNDTDAKLRVTLSVAVSLVTVQAVAAPPAVYPGASYFIGDIIAFNMRILVGGVRRCDQEQVERVRTKVDIAIGKIINSRVVDEGSHGGIGLG
jgi:hypothetical protein